MSDDFTIDGLRGNFDAYPEILAAADEIERLERELRNVKRTLIAVLDTTGPVAVPRTTLVAIGGQSTLTVDETLRAHSQLAVIFSAKATTDE